MAQQSDEKLVECQLVLADCATLVQRMEQLILQQHSLNNKLMTDYDAVLLKNRNLKKENSMWYRNPWITGTLGIAVGVLAIEVAR